MPKPEVIRQVWSDGLIRALHNTTDCIPDPLFTAWDQTVFELFSLFPNSSLAEEWQALGKEEKIGQFRSHQFSFDQFVTDFEAGVREGTNQTKEE